MTTLHFMIGMPASGKTTWRENYRKINSSIVASSDDFIEEMAKEQGKTYNEVFAKMSKGGERYVNALASYCVKHQVPMIWDQTNLSVATRAKRLAFFPSQWKKIGVNVKCKNFETWKDRLMTRPGKIIPAGTIEHMMKTFETPTFAEGFDEIIEIET
jgi:tRNA uridine 5-carbamoylmethylation protein Kti12